VSRLVSYEVFVPGDGHDPHLSCCCMIPGHDLFPFEPSPAALALQARTSSSLPPPPPRCTFPSSPLQDRLTYHEDLAEQWAFPPRSRTRIHCTAFGRVFSPPFSPSRCSDLPGPGHSTFLPRTRSPSLRFCCCLPDRIVLSPAALKHVSPGSTRRIFDLDTPLFYRTPRPTTSSLLGRPRPKGGFRQREEFPQWLRVPIPTPPLSKPPRS